MLSQGRQYGNLLSEPDFCSKLRVKDPTVSQLQVWDAGDTLIKGSTHEGSQQRQRRESTLTWRFE